MLGLREVMAGLSMSKSETQLHALYALTVETGLRRGKVLCPRWLDVDLNVGEVRIQQTLISTSHQVTLRQSRLGAVADLCQRLEPWRQSVREPSSTARGSTRVA